MFVAATLADSVACPSPRVDKIVGVDTETESPADKRLLVPVPVHDMHCQSVTPVGCQQAVNGSSYPSSGCGM